MSKRITTTQFSNFTTTQLKNLSRITVETPSCARRTTNTFFVDTMNPATEKSASLCLLWNQVSILITPMHVDIFQATTPRAMSTMMIPKALNLNGVGSSIHDSLVNRNDSLYVESIDSLRLLPSFFDLGEDETEKDLIGRCSKAQSEDNFETATVCDEREILLYLIGHGESELQSLRDAKLSDVGRSDAQHAGKRLSKMEQPPSCVLVSPLALETANIVFPEHPNLQVRYDLSERGMPPHKRSSSLRRAFRRLREESLSSLEASDSLEFSDSEHSDEQHNELYRRKHDRSEGRDFRLIRRLRDENREELRKRTQRLLSLLGESVDTSVAVVTHKGYLRELENGPLGQTDVQEFDNCEARVYRLVLSTNRLVVAKRVR